MSDTAFPPPAPAELADRVDAALSAWTCEALTTFDLVRAVQLLTLAEAAARLSLALNQIAQERP
jgi:hypothetical protein